MITNTTKMSAISKYLLTGVILSVMVMVGLSYGLGVIMSGSMEPGLIKNDLILIRKTHDCQVGDIVVYESNGQMIVHRVVAIEGDMVTVKGDANNAADDPIRMSDICGVAVTRICNLPLYQGNGLSAKYVSTASGSSKALVAEWDVNALEEVSETMHIMAGETEYTGDAYEFSVTSNSETTAEYCINIVINAIDDGTSADSLSLGLFTYDNDRGGWYQVAQNIGSQLNYSGLMPIGGPEHRFRLKAMAGETDAVGCYRADIDVEVTQVD